VELRLGEEIKILDARPSDALALAVRLEVPIYVNKEVLDRAQATLIPVDASGAPVGTIGEFITSDDEAMSKEEEFVSSIANNPDELVEQRIVPFAELDKDTLKEILADMDPEDFKYKM
jgi:bifunctional DNase/RNase